MAEYKSNAYNVRQRFAAAATIAWHPLGMRKTWLPEIETFPSVVLAHHYQHTPNLGDMTRLPLWCWLKSTNGLDDKHAEGLTRERWTPE